MYTFWSIWGHLPQFKENIEPSISTHWFELSAKAKVLNTKFCIHWGIMYASLKTTTVLSYNCIGYWEHFYILEKLGASLGRVFSAIWCEWLNGLWHCDQSPMGTLLGVDTQPLPVNFGSKIDSPNAVITFGWVRLFPQ